MLYQPQHANGERLRLIREDAGLSIPQAIELCNKECLRHLSLVKFTDKKLRRFEEIGITERYGTTPPTYEELHIMMRVYNGSFAFLYWGLEPIRYPIEKYELLVSKYLDTEIWGHLEWLDSLTETKRKKIIQLIREVAD